MIPKVRHAVWAAHDPMPYTFKANLATWQEHMPDWDLLVWGEEQLAEMPMVNRDLYDAAKTEAPDDWIRWRADIARLEIVYQFGGVYADTDCEAVASLDPLLEIPCWFAESPNAPGLATNAVFGAEAGHPFLRFLLNAIPTRNQAWEGARINRRVGSRFVADFIRAAQPKDVEVLPHHWFASQSIKGRGNQPATTPLYTDHHYFNSERHAAKPQIAAFRAAADVLDASGATWFLTSGLLLGHVREGRILPWDLDVDLGIFADDAETVRQAFKDAGWQFRRDFLSQMWPVHGNTKVDIHTHYREGDQVYKLHGKQQRIRMDHPAHLFENLQPTVFYMRECLMPSPPEEYLEVMYGEDWLTPKREWQWDESPRNITRI